MEDAAKSKDFQICKHDTCDVCSTSFYRYTLYQSKIPNWSCWNMYPSLRKCSNSGVSQKSWFLSETMTWISFISFLWKKAVLLRERPQVHQQSWCHEKGIRPNASEVFQAGEFAKYCESWTWNKLTYSKDSQFALKNKQNQCKSNTLGNFGSSCFPRSIIPNPPSHRANAQGSGSLRMMHWLPVLMVSFVAMLPKAIF